MSALEGLRELLYAKAGQTEIIVRVELLEEIEEELAKLYRMTKP